LEDILDRDEEQEWEEDELEKIMLEKLLDSKHELEYIELLLQHDIDEQLDMQEDDETSTLLDEHPDLDEEEEVEEDIDDIEDELLMDNVEELEKDDEDEIQELQLILDEHDLLDFLAHEEEL